MRLVTPIPTYLKPAAAEIYYEAFRGKVGWLLGPDERAQKFLSGVINPHHGYAVVEGDGDNAILLGIAGFKTSDGSFAQGTFTDIVSFYGIFGALWRVLPLMLLERGLENDVLLMDGIAVTKQARGKGVGTMLLDAIIAHAKNAGKSRVRLDVINTNPRARTLYERKGFVAVGEERFPLMQRWYGFDHSTTMEHQVTEV